MTVTKFLYIGAASYILAGCAVPIGQLDRATRQNTTPEVGSTQTVGVGETMLESKNVEFIKGRIVDGPARATVAVFPFEFNGMYARANNGQHYCGIATNRDPLNYGKRTLVCYTDQEFKNLNIPYRDGEELAQGRPGIRRVVEYSGKSGTSISVYYKEFADSETGSMARSAFTQEFKFELSDGKTVGIKGARLEIIEANNTGVKYKVLAPLQ